MKKDTGYSLIEFMMVLLIFGVMLSIIFGSISASRKGWQGASNQIDRQQIARKALEFIPCGQFVEATADTSAPAIIPEGPEPSVGPLVAGVAASPPTEPPRAGTIAIELANGARLTVDSFVNEKALARVLRALKAVPC